MKLRTARMDETTTEKLAKIHIIIASSKTTPKKIIITTALSVVFIKESKKKTIYEPSDL